MKERPVPTVILAVLIFGALAASAASQSPDPTSIEQYKAYLADLGNLGTRYTASNAFYLSIVTGLIAVLSFKEMNRPVRDYINATTIFVFGFIAIICFLWWDTIQFYHGLFGEKLSILAQMEKANPKLFPAFTDELKTAPSRGLTQRDSDIAFVIGVLALVIFVTTGFIQIWRWITGSLANDAANSNERILRFRVRFEQISDEIDEFHD